MKKTIIFDVETGPLDLEELDEIMPPFNPDDVKVGNIKNPDLIATKIEYERLSYRQDYFKKAALDPLTGQVLAIGTATKELGHWKTNIVGTGDLLSEKDLLKDFWNDIRWEFERLHQMVGFNIHAFDLPFLVRRSWKHGIEVPRAVRKGRYWSDDFVDLRVEWQLGNRDHKGSLDSIAKHLGLGGKTGSGADFAALYGSDKEKAIAYLDNDLMLTAAVYERIGGFL